MPSVPATVAEDPDPGSPPDAGGEQNPPDILDRIAAVLAEHKGACPVYIQVRPARRPEVRATIRADRQWFVAPCRPLLDRLESLLGQENLVLCPRPAPAANANGTRYGNGRGNGYAKANGNGASPGRYAPTRPANAPADAG